MSDLQRLNEERLEELEALYGEGLDEWIVFSVSCVGGRLRLDEISQLKAVDDKIAILRAAEANHTKAGGRMFALPAGTVRGVEVEMTHVARIVGEA